MVIYRKIDSDTVEETTETVRNLKISQINKEIGDMEREIQTITSRLNELKIKRDDISKL